ncbi:unnamed protein product [Penicillium olsonii]|nr:unnamed protein product [Penicillium olsonii]
MSQSEVKRKRARMACEPCRERKRKCDGDEPCSTCREWAYDCYYDRQPRRRRTTQHRETPTEVAPGPSSPYKSPADGNGLVRRLEANSGAAFVRKMGLKIDPAKAPKLSLFGWNIGKRNLSSQLESVGSALTITEITSLEHMKSLAQVYFEKVHPCYGFINRSRFFERLTARWKSSFTNELYDSVIGGVTAIGCLFSQRNMTMTEMHLVASACSTLERQVLSGTPPVDLLTGWTLRVIYMRITDLPHATWMESSKLMHLIEAAGFHRESADSVFPRSCTTSCDPDIRRRLFGVAQHLNMWTSYDLGLSRVSFQKDDLPLPPSVQPGDFTHEVLGLLPVSASLDPGNSKENEVDLEATLSNTLNGYHVEAPSIMAQCNLVLCILRRIHTQSLDIPSHLADRVLILLKKALDCARTMVLGYSPWHQMANVPFQITCVLLVMDTRPSLSMLPEAMQTLKLVASTYDTDSMREAWSAARLLVMLHQQRRKDDIAIFNQSLDLGLQEPPLGPSPQDIPSAEEYSWLGALVADLPGLQKVDLDQFLNADMMDGPDFIDG